MESTQHHTLLAIWWRVVLLWVPVLFVAYLDRVNLGFAALGGMNHALHLSNTQFGTAAGVFSFGYAAAGIPSTVMLHRWGARRWISLTMVVWGVCSGATAFVNQPAELYGIRVLLGMAEAGLAPGAVVYFSQWFPSEYRGRVFGTFFVINPISQLIGGPLSSVLLNTDGWLGWAPWQWLFIIEAAPTLVLAVVVLSLLPDRPGEARWLSAGEKQWLQEQLGNANTPASIAATSSESGYSALTDGRVWRLAAIGMGLGTCGIGIVIFLPLIIHSMGFSTWNTGFVSAIPAALAAIALPLWGFWTDRVREREWVVAAGCGTIAFGLLSSAAFLPSAWALVPLSLAVAAFFGCLAAFWTLPAAFLTGIRAATGIALINVAGNLGQFVGPYLLGRLADLSQSHVRGLLCLAVIAAVTAMLTLAKTNGAARLLRRVRAARVTPY